MWLSFLWPKYFGICQLSTAQLKDYAYAYATGDVDPAVAAALLMVHNNVYIAAVPTTQQKAPKTDQPAISGGSSEETWNVFYLSKEALIQLGVISPDFPRIDAVTETSSIDDTQFASCGCPARTTPPPRPNILPFTCSPENNKWMKQWSNSFSNPHDSPSATSLAKLCQRVTRRWRSSRFGKSASWRAVRMVSLYGFGLQSRWYAKENSRLVPP